MSRFEKVNKTVTLRNANVYIKTKQLCLVHIIQHSKPVRDVFEAGLERDIGVEQLEHTFEAVTPLFLGGCGSSS